MSPDLRGRDQFERAYTLVRGRVSEGGYASGARLSVAAIVAELRLSPTPVREALSRLVGEGVIEDRRGNGYYMARLDADTIAGLYRLRSLCLGGLLERMPRDNDLVDRSNGPQESVVAPADAIFSAILGASDDLVLRQAARLASERLILARRLEAEVIAGIATETECLRVLLAEPSYSRLRRTVRRYHDRRAKAAPALAAAIAREARRGSPI